MQNTGKRNKPTIRHWIAASLLIFLISACSDSTPAVTPPNTSSPSATTPSSLQTSTPFTPSATQSPTIPAPTTAAPTDLPPVTTLPDAAQYTWKKVVGGLDFPVGIVSADDGSGRLFVIEKKGVISIIQNGEIAPGPFLDIRDRVGSGGLEQGLLGLAFHPDYKNNGYFYVDYTNIDGNTIIARYSVTSFNPNRADAETEQRLLEVDQPYSNHNGGQLAFGPDGYLYIGLGDGGSAGDPHGHGQSLNTLLGKILRIDVNHGNPYAIPSDNPFVNGPGKPEIWVYGLRNPWRFSFDLLTKDLYIGDVGQNEWEEIDFLPAGSPGGENFGWNYLEGTHPFKGTPPTGLKLTPPVAEYSHNLGCSVSGGYVYRGQSLPAWDGVYLYGDWCSGRIWGLLHKPDGSWQNEQLFQTDAKITSFGQDETGEIYMADSSGSIYKLTQKP